MIGLLETKEEKFKFLIQEYFKLTQKELAKEFDVRETEMSKIINNQEKKLKNIHILGFCHLYDVPYEIFTNKKLDTEEKVILFLDSYKSSQEEEIFQKDEQLMKNLVGTWYAYLYPSSLISPIQNNGIWIVKTVITEDYKVIDEHNNKGILQVGKHQSLIIKEANTEKNLTVIRFLNRQVTYKIFRFVIVSNQNITNNDMVNFGFYSKEKYSPEIAKEILGDIKKVQLKLDLEFDERMSAFVRI